MSPITLFAVLLLNLSAWISVPMTQTKASAEHGADHLMASLPPQSPLREMLERGDRGDGIHYGWMDQMRRQGVKLTRLSFEFDWTEKGKQLVNWRFVSARYFRDYDELEVVTDAKQITELSGLKKDLADAALTKAKQANWFEYPFESRGTGYIFVLLADDEWLPLTPCVLTQFNRGLPPLITATIVGNLAEINQLVAGGAEVNTKDNQGNTAVAWAATVGDPLALQLLLDKGGDANSSSTGQDSILASAVTVGQQSSVEILLRNGADPNSTNSHGERLLSVATREHRADIAMLLKNAGARD